MNSCGWFLAIHVLAAHGTGLTPLHSTPDVRGYIRGIDAVGMDPGAVGAADGFALQYRHRVVQPERGPGRIGGYALAPLGPMTFFGGYEWQRSEGRRFERGVIGVAGSLGPLLSIGVSYRGLRSKHPELSGGLWSVGVFSEPLAWLTVTAGVDGFNGPRLLGGILRPDYVLGASVRPLFAEPWLTLGGEVRMGAGSVGEYGLNLARAILDAQPVEGVHALVAYGYETNEGLPLGSRVALEHPGHRLWVGLGLSMGIVESRGGLLAYGSPGDPDAPAAEEWQLALTVRSNPSESLFWPGRRFIEVPLVGKLEARRRSVIDLGSPISVAALQLDALAEDPTVDEVLLPIAELDVGLATIEELRAGIKRLRAAGKHVTAHLGSAGDKEYMVAAACNLIRMDPSATVSVDGFYVTLRYFAGALAKVGVRVEAVEVGRYKSGPDPLTRTEPRPEDLETQAEILDEAERSLMTALVEDRGLSAEAAQRLVDKGRLTASEAVTAGLVDELTTPTDPEALPALQPRGSAFEITQGPSRLWSELPTIQIVPVVGTIVGRPGDNPLPGPSAVASQIIEALDDAAGDRDVRAVVLRVESPGGDVVASELIWRAIRRVEAIKPVVVSMGDVAASGGYWVSAPADLILVEPNTVTGSIGIFSILPNVTGLYEMLGINTETLKRGENADLESWEQPMTDHERAMMRHTMEAYYEDFLARVATGRHMTRDRVAQLAQGRVYTGRRAVELGLADSIGGVADAVREAQRLAGLSPTAQVRIGLPEYPWTLTRAVRNLTGIMARQHAPIDALWQDLGRRLSAWDGRVLALMPVAYELHH